ncbi:putative membrane protein YkoI [Streptosporangium becharense]|uniref:Putative membrane protein YkoI n=1 Tax=Streptosporangium becharense TaxID=1816182 RepID=A0A7W9IKD5_9ACTN|nr:PepSY domain-containing protein [Streptosporangium becharense]MBB2910906.1 putative membrane protein YkoI [Streptosporangium becharense]MBB5822035.1 putative membrane protein YkoI [Streptosporangium becharense]
MRPTWVLLVLITAVTACGNGPATPSPSPPDTPAPAPSALTTPVPVTFAEAAGIAERAAQGRLTDLQLYAAQPPAVWLAQVLGRDGRTLTGLRVNAVTGAVSGEQMEDPEELTTATRRLAADRIGAMGAWKAASGAVPGAWITAAVLEETGGVVVWEVEAIDSTRKVRKILVNAATGATIVLARDARPALPGGSPARP